MKVYVNNLQDKIAVDPNLIERLEELIVYALKNEDVPSCELGVTLTNNNTIKELNQRYRKINEVTDVLSFPLTEEDDSCLTGDIVISLEKAVVQAEEYGHSFLREVLYLAIHGLYHILGHKHDNEEDKKKMRIKEEKMLENFDLSR